MRLVPLLVLASLVPSSAAFAAAPDVSGWTASSYADWLGVEGKSMETATRSYLDGVGRDDEATNLGRRMGASIVVQMVRDDVATLAPYQGDGALKNAYLAWCDDVRAVLDDDGKSPADVRAALDRDDTRLQAAVLAFDAAHGVDTTQVDAFTTELAVLYHDQLVAILEGDKAAVGRFTSAYDREAARYDLEAQLESTIATLEGLGSFEGDDTLRLPLLGYERRFLQAVEDADGGYDDDAAFAPVDAAEAQFAHRWNFGLHDSDSSTSSGTSSSGTSSYGTSSYGTSSNSYAGSYTPTDASYTPPPADPPPPEDGWVAYRGGVDRGEGRKGYDLGVTVGVSPKVAIAYDFRHAKLEDPTQHRQALGFGVDYDVLHVGGDFGLTLMGEAGLQWGWGQGDHAAGLLLGAEADVDVPGPFFAYGAVQRGVWGAPVKDDIGGWMLDAGVGVRIHGK